MAVKHTFNYLRSTSNGVEKRTETKNLTRNQAIKFLCLDCSGGFTTEVASCQIQTCPLWAFRPYQRKSNLSQQRSQGSEILK